MHANDDTPTVHRLPRGEVAHLRLLEAGETGLVQDVFDQMSDQSRFLRFHAATPRLSAAALRHLAATEPGRHTVVVALLRGRAVGLARWIRLRHEPTTAELAADVGDSFQGGGLGRALVVEAAANATRAGITHFMCAVHPENGSVRRVLRRLGARTRAGRHDELYLPIAALTDQNGAAQEPSVVVPWPRAVRRTGSLAGGPQRT